jgi:hypothetical protein
MVYISVYIRKILLSNEQPIPKCTCASKIVCNELRCSKKSPPFLLFVFVR